MVAEDFKLECQYTLLDLIPVEKYRSTKTGLSVCIAKVHGPLVNGYFCLATEAHDDDGLPHTLEHLVFMGSEKYPYKGILDLFANRCLAQGTNAWTDVDHTCYTLTTAGSAGFLNLLPIYLDHVFYPTLTKSSYITEVHHVNGDGEDAGVVYCEMQGRENTGNSRTHLEFCRQMYAGHCGYKSETGGITENLRTSTNHEKVCNYHSSFYRPDNICLIITGQVDSEDVLKTVKNFEEKIISKGQLPDFKRPWQTPVPGLGDTVEKVVLFPTEDESNGMFLMGWRGPSVLEYYKICALKILGKYLTDTSVAPLQQELVEIEDPLASDVNFSQMENLEMCIYLKVDGVPKDKLFQVRERIENVLKNHAEKETTFDMERMHTVLHRELLENMDSLEDSPHDTMAGGIIGDFLYSDKPDRLPDYLDECTRLKQLKTEPESFWVETLGTFLVQRSKIVIIGEPSEKLMKDMAQEEEQRVKEQAKTLGEAGLNTQQETLDKANAENEVEPPPDLVATLKIPSTDSIHFHSIQTISNRRKENSTTVESKFAVDNIPFAFQLDNIKSLFMQMNVILDTSVVPDELRWYLPLYTEIIFESPLLRNGELIPYEEVVKQLAKDTSSNNASLGFSGSTFGPGRFSQVFILSVKLEIEKFQQGIQWLHELLYKIQFSAERLKIVATKIINDIPNVKRNGRKVALALIRDINFTKGGSFYVTNVVRQQQFLSRLVQHLDENPQKVLEDLEKLRTVLTNPSHLRFFLAADINKLPANANSVIKEKLLPHPLPVESLELRPPLIKWDLEFLCDKTSSKVVGVGSVESAFLYRTSKGIKSFQDPDYAPLLVLVEYLCTCEGPLWRQIRGLGLAYHYNISVDPGKGLISFILMKSTHIFSAYQKGKEIVDAYISGTNEFEPGQIEAAISGVIFEIISQEQSIGDAAFESMLSVFKEVDQAYNRDLLRNVSRVTEDDLKRVIKTYLTQLFDPSQSSCALCCHPSKVEEVVKSFKSISVDFQVIQSLEEGFSLDG